MSNVGAYYTPKDIVDPALGSGAFLKHELPLDQMVRDAMNVLSAIEHGVEQWCGPAKQLIGDVAIHVLALASEVETLRKELIERDQLLGSIAAQDKREREAAEKCGILWQGCDTPDAMAEEILALREEVAKLSQV